jgi:hypothetical protein
MRIVAIVLSTSYCFIFLELKMCCQLRQILFWDVCRICGCIMKLKKTRKKKEKKRSIRHQPYFYFWQTGPKICPLLGSCSLQPSQQEVYNSNCQLMLLDEV